MQSKVEKIEDKYYLVFYEENTIIERKEIAEKNAKQIEIIERMNKLCKEKRKR